MSLINTSTCRFMGLDLAGNPDRPTGWALVDEDVRLCMQPGELFADEQILNKIVNIKPQWIGIDAPLSFPKNKHKVRLCDRELRKFGSPALSPFLIASLTRRGIRLSELLGEKGYRCIEVYPRATQKILGIKARGKKSELSWRTSCQTGISRWVKRLNSPEDITYSSHILDAILCAYTACCRGKGCYQEVGNEEGRVVVPIPWVC